jgi:gamma-glutamylcyclotransferase (GGCT)/AIG2-like uncharacterized protein YtfP
MAKDTKEFLFVYALLKPQYYPPKTMSMHMKDSIKGKLYDLDGKDAAGVNIGKDTAHRIEGYTIAIDPKELPTLEREEQPEFKRVKTTTEAGIDVYVYEYTKPIPLGSKLISGQWRRK